MRRLHKVLTRRVSWRGCRWSLRQALSGRDAGPSGRHLLTAPKPGEVLPAMPPFQLRAARKDLADILDEVSGARRVFPSLALLERALATPGGEGIHEVEACILRHAAQSLDKLGDDWFSPGIVVLRRRVELILRRRHDALPSQQHGTRRRDFSEALTEFMDIDRPLRGHPPAFVERRDSKV
ncbi:MAG: hypothetical protein ACJ8GJ_13830 [Vitreoscilla sp.]